MKILIIGSDGLLGRDVSKIFSNKYPDSIVEATEAFLDIKDYDRTAIEFERLLPAAVINCAAMTHVDECEDNPGKAFSINRDGAFNVARACKHIRARLIHISTDYVFDGRKKSPYKETDETAPLSIYGKSKLEGEKAVLKECENSLIIRTSSLFGMGGENFGSKIISRCEQGERVKAAIDWFSSPTSTRDLARGIEKLLPLEHKGVLHFVNSGVCSKFEFALTALKMKNIDDSLLIPIKMNHLKLKAIRPIYSALDNRLFAKLSGETPRKWEEALRDYLFGEH